MAQLYWPFDPSRITEGYGWADWRQGVHDGIDFGIGQGTELRATASGIVRNNDAGARDGAGVDITTDDGWKVRHWHVSEFLVPNGSYVNAGDVIARTGGAKGTWGAGFSTGPHLHWGVKTGAGWVDPASLGPAFFGSAPTPAAPAVGPQGEGIRGAGSDWTYWVPGTRDQMTVQARLAERGLYTGPIDGDLASDASVRAIKLACGNLGYFDLTYWDGQINKNLCYGILLLAQNHGGYSGWNNLFTDGHVWAAFDAGVANAIAVPAPEAPPAPTPEAKPEPEPTPEPEKPKKKPAVKPEQNEHKEKPVAEITPISKEEIQAQLNKQSQLVSGIKPADLGAIITNNKARKIVWAIYGIVGLAIIGVMGGLTAAQWLAPSWFIFATGAYTALGPAFSSLAMANIDTKK